MVRYRIMTTNQGQYIRFLGKSDNRIGRILAFVDGEKYNIPVTGGDYFIEPAIINKPTKSDFPSGSVWYDRTNKEL
ncbi:MAG: hypothetical protein ACQEXQ_23015 [Bacillota bacterium]